MPPYRLSANVLLLSAAITAGPRLIAVVLPGRGNDASTGASAVHRFGGTVIAIRLETSTRLTIHQATIGRDQPTDHVVARDEVAALSPR